MGAAYVALDLETTGLDPGRDEIIEIGLIQVRGGEIIERFESLVWTDRAIPPWVARLTGISNEDLEGAPTFSDLAESLVGFLGCLRFSSIFKPAVG